mgnify:CR=1 FL=1
MFCEYLVKDITCKFKPKFNYLSKNYCTRHYNIIQKSLNEKNINKDDELILELKNILTKYKILYDSIEYLDKDTFNIIYLISFQNNKYILKYQNLLNNKNLLYYEYILLSQLFNNHNNIVKLDSINKKNYIYIKDSYSILLQEYLIENLQRKKERYNFTLNEILDRRGLTNQPYISLKSDKNFYDFTIDDFEIHNIDGIKKQLIKLVEKVEDNTIKIKINEVVNLIKPLDKNQSVKDDDIITLLTYHQLVAELKSVK